MLDQFSKEEDSIAHGEKVELKVALFVPSTYYISLVLTKILIVCLSNEGKGGPLLNLFARHCCRVSDWLRADKNLN